jgi:non-ribosomal peptide synthetase component F
MAVWKAGGAYVPLEPSFPDERLDYMVKDSGAAVLLVDGLGRKRIGARAEGLQLLDVCGDEALSDRPTRRPPSAASPAQLAYVLYTSGSTGRPKGVAIEHRAVTNLLWSMKGRPGLSAGERVRAVTTVSFDIAALELFLPLVVGGTVVLAPDAIGADGPKPPSGRACIGSPRERAARCR